VTVVSDLEEALRKIALHDDALIESALGETPNADSYALDPKTRALARIAVLIAMDGSLSSYVARVQEAQQAGATLDEIVGVLIGVAHDVGGSRAISAASALAGALQLDDPPR
jgi:alkylhydroperoxidase/carboxymuconolactone decarboxylase family protein YurZ